MTSIIAFLFEWVRLHRLVAMSYGWVYLTASPWQLKDKRCYGHEVRMLRRVFNCQSDLGSRLSQPCWTRYFLLVEDADRIECGRNQDSHLVSPNIRGFLVGIEES